MARNNYTTYSFSPEEVEEAVYAPSAVVVPQPGTYRVTIMDVKEDEFKSQANAGLPRLIVTFRVVDAPTKKYVGATVKSFTVPLEPNWKNGRRNPNFFQFWLAVGAYDKRAKAFAIPEDVYELVDPENTLIIRVENEHNAKGYVNANITEFIADKGQELEIDGEPLQPTVRSTPRSAGTPGGVSTYGDANDADDDEEDFSII